jgi:hypothetical protein
MRKTVHLRSEQITRNEVLAAFLNGADATAEGKRAEVLHQNFLKLQTMLEDIVKHKKYIQRTTETPSGRLCGWVADKNVAALQHSTNQLLSRYNFVRQVHPWLNPDEPTVPIETNSVRSEPKVGAVIPISETQAVDLLLRLAEANGLTFITRCPVCRNWFAVRRPDHKRCGPVCHKQWYREQNPDKYNEQMRKQRAAAQMKKYRADKKTQRERELHTVNFVRKGKRHA